MGKSINAQLLASLEAAATETELAAAKIDVAVKGSVAAMDSVVSTVIIPSNQLQASLPLPKVWLWRSFYEDYEKMAEEAAKVTDAPAGADLASMTVDKISTVVDKVKKKLQRRNSNCRPSA